MHWMTGIPPQVLKAQAPAPKPADPRAYVLRVGNWIGHSLGEVVADTHGRRDLEQLLRMPAWAVREDVKGYIRAVLSEAGSAE